MKIVFIAGLREGYECIKSTIEDGWEVVGVFTLTKIMPDSLIPFSISVLKKRFFPREDLTNSSSPGS